MALQHNDLKQGELSHSIKKITKNADQEAIETSWLIDNLPVTVFRVLNKPAWPIHYISKNVDELTGYSAREFLSQKLAWADIVFPEDVPKIDAAIDKSVKSGNPYQVEYRIKKSCGDTVFVQEQAHLVNDDNGNLAYIDGVFLDVTQHIKRREESQKAIVRSIPSPSLALYVDVSGKIKHINNYFLEVCRFKSESEVIGRTSAELLETNSRRTLVDKAIETGEGIYNLEKSIKFKALDKPLFTILSAVPIKDETGTIVGGLMVITNMTEMKEREEEVKDLLGYTDSCLKNLGEGIRKLSEGYLDAHLEKIKDDDFGDTFDEFNKLVLNLKSVIEHILEDMLTTLEEARQSEEAVGQMNAGMQQISTAAEQIATGSENLSRHAGTAASDIKASQEIFSRLSDSSNKSSDYASQAGKKSEEAQVISNQALEDMEQVVAEISKLGGIVHSLDDAVNNIGSVTGKIKSIADQTNLLALNAAIEAARAGEYGRGFAVVADEVRKLAADSRKSTDEINEIVTNVQKETKKVTEAINIADGQAKTGSKNIKQALNAGHEIATAVATINSMLAELDRLSDEGLAKIENIEKSISETASTAEENAASSEETSAAIEEQTAAMQQVSSSVKNVSELAQKTVDSLIENFKISAELKKDQPPSGKPLGFERRGKLKTY
ncbi:methyl-accepting chemotaxis protein [Methanosarcina hadiensis]|uniref:methyl-accepting chemotaxis protein n=1 Tax=Methanosarcina hadiensis TaxID=3078083 RepID=UPI003977D9B3